MQGLPGRRMPVRLRARARALCCGCALFLIALLAGGCASTPPDAPAALDGRSVGVSVIQSDSFRFDWETRIDPVQVDLERCAQHAIADSVPSLRLVPHTELASALTPDLPQGAAPLSMASLRVLFCPQTMKEFCRFSALLLSKVFCCAPQGSLADCLPCPTIAMCYHQTTK